MKRGREERRWEREGGGRREEEEGEREDGIEDGRGDWSMP